MSASERGGPGTMRSKKVRRLLLVGGVVALVAGNLVTWAGVGSSAPSAGGPVVTAGTPVAPAVASIDVSSLRRPAVIPKITFPEPRPPLQIGAVKQPLPNAPKAPSTPAAGPSTPAPGPISTFKGLSNSEWGAGWPPDTVGDVGPNDYVQAVNTSIGIFRKTDGTRLAAFTFDQLWGSAHPGTGTTCDDQNQGDP